MLACDELIVFKVHFRKRLKCRYRCHYNFSNFVFVNLRPFQIHPKLAYRAKYLAINLRYLISVTMNLWIVWKWQKKVCQSLPHLGLTSLGLQSGDVPAKQCLYQKQVKNLLWTLQEAMRIWLNLGKRGWYVNFTYLWLLLKKVSSWLVSHKLVDMFHDH